MPHESLKYFAEVIEKEMGINFTQGNMYQLETRLKDIAHQENTTIAELARVVREGNKDQLKQKIFDHATNNETLFFRDPVYFEAITDFIEQRILPLNPTRIKLWSAACSTGQEPLSLAITLNELAKKKSLPPFSIVATDISEKALSRAQHGHYTDFEIRRGLPDKLRDTYFEESGGHWAAKKELLSKIEYRSNNLVRPTLKDHFHLILCRNVLIYHQLDVKKKVVNYLMSNLSLDGAILLGVGETLLGVVDNPSLKLIRNVAFYSKAS